MTGKIQRPNCATREAFNRIGGQARSGAEPLWPRLLRMSELAPPPFCVRQSLAIGIQFRRHARDTAAPLVIFPGAAGHLPYDYHATWRDFPARLCDAAGVRGLVYSRPATVAAQRQCPHGDKWGVDFMHRQASDVNFLRAAGGTSTSTPPVNKPWLFGHSDGGSIALDFTLRAFPGRVGAIVAAPHLRHRGRLGRALQHGGVSGHRPCAANSPVITMMLIRRSGAGTTSG